MTKILENRIDFVLFFDVKDGNPNGDPDAGNRPRTDPETGHGLVSNVCLKRKIRDYVSLAKEGEDGFEIYQTNGSVLNLQHQRAYDGLGLAATPKKLPKDKLQAANVTDWMTKTFFDVRAFGAVMSTEVNAGQVRGPVQIEFARSIEPVMPMEVSITRGSVTNEKDIDKDRTMGSKYILPYGLYRVHGYINAPMARKAGFTEDDLDLVMLALRDMFDLDRSATRGEMAARELIIFRHDSKLGNAPAHRLFDRVVAKRVSTAGPVDVDSLDAAALPPARKFADYVIEVSDADMPAGVTLDRPWS